MEKVESRSERLETVGNFVVWLKNWDSTRLLKYNGGKGLSSHRLREIVKATRRRFYDSFKEYTIFEDRRIGKLLDRIQEVMGERSMTSSERVKSRRDNQKLMMGRDMMRTAREVLWVRQESTIEDKMIYIGMAWSYHVGNRKGEVSNTGRQKVKDKWGNVLKDHRYMADDWLLVYGDTDVNAGKSIRPWEVTEENVGRLGYAMVEKDTSKPDSKGHKLYANYCAKEGPEGELFEDLLMWCRIAGMESGKPFFSRVLGEHRLVLHGKMLADGIKSIAERHGFNRNNFSVKSLRKGCSNTLELMGIPLSQQCRINRRANPMATSADSYNEVEGVTGAFSFKEDDPRHVTSSVLKKRFPRACSVGGALSKKNRVQTAPYDVIQVEEHEQATSRDQRSEARVKTSRPRVRREYLPEAYVGPSSRGRMRKLAHSIQRPM